MSSANPFSGARRRRKHVTNWGKGLDPLRSSSKRPRIMHRGYYDIEISSFHWFSDRADMLDVTLAALIRDILTAWQQGVIAGEDERGIRVDDERPSFDVPERGPGYTDAIFPRGRATSHLDSSPLGLGEL